MRELEQQHCKHFYSKKNNQRMKDIGHIPDTLIKVGHELMSEGKVLQVIVKIDVKHRGAAEGSWLSVGKIEIPCFCFLYVGKVHKSSV